MNQDVAAESPNNTKKLFAIKEIHTHDGYDGRPISYEHIVSTDGNEDDVAIFETESAAAGWMADHGYKTLDESRSELLASFEAQYAKDLQQYQKDLSEVEKMRAAGVAARLHPKLSHPREPAISEFWVPSIYHEIVPACVVG